MKKYAQKYFITIYRPIRIRGETRIGVIIKGFGNNLLDAWKYFVSKKVENDFIISLETHTYYNNCIYTVIESFED